MPSIACFGDRRLVGIHALTGVVHQHGTRETGNALGLE